MEPGKALRIFSGATAIITGGASGIGRALAKALSKRGCETVLADLQIELAEEVASGIRARGGKATAVKTDVTDFTSVEQLVKETVKRTGRLDYIFNNAGIGIGGNVSDYGINDWNYIVSVNLGSVINGVQAAYPVMVNQGFGHIVNTASMAGLMPSPGNTAYATTKYALVGLSQSLRGEASRHGVRVSVLCPGVIRTPILEGGKYGKMLVEISPEKMRRFWEKLKPMAPDLFAEKVLTMVARNKPIIIVPSWWKRYWRINRFFPSFGISLAEKWFQKSREELGLA